jgi:hypothetical protein
MPTDKKQPITFGPHTVIVWDEEMQWHEGFWKCAQCSLPVHEFATMEHQGVKFLYVFPCNHYWSEVA